MPYLIVSRGGRLEREVELRTGTLRIGRDPENELVLDDPDRGASRFHAEIRCDGTDCTVTDLESRNGTWIDGARINSMAISPGAVVTIGSYSLEYKADAVVQHPSESAAPDYTVFSPPSPAPPDFPAPPAPKPPGPSVARVPRVPVARQRQALLFLWASIGVACLLGIGWYRGRARVPVAPQHQPPPPPADKGELRYTPKVDIAQQLSEVRGLIVQRDFPTASRALDDVLRADPNNADAAALRGELESAIASAAGAVSPGTGEPPPPPKKPRETPRQDPTVVVRRPGENQTDWQVRNRRVQDAYAAAKAALSSDDVPLAIAKFEAVERDQPSYLDVPALLLNARDLLRTQAQQALDAAAAAEQSGALNTALQKYTRARQLIPAIDVEGAISRVREEMLKQGANAYRQARQNEALDRTVEAARLYERAVALLPADDERRQDANRRLQILKSKP